MASKAWSTTHSSTAGTEARQLLSKRNLYAQSGGVTKRRGRDGSRGCGGGAQHARIRGALRGLLCPPIRRHGGYSARHHFAPIHLTIRLGLLTGAPGIVYT